MLIFFLTIVKKSLEKYKVVNIIALRVLRLLNSPIAFDENLILLSKYHRFLCKGNFLDVGANFGQSSRWFIHEFNPSKIVAYEPQPNLIKYLKRLKSLSSGFDYRNVGVSNISGNIDIEVKYYFGLADDTTSCIIERDDIYSINSYSSRFYVTSKFFSCKTIRLDDEVSKVDFIKIDVEGHEVKVLQGAVNLLINSNAVIFIEVVNDIDKIISFLNSLGYTLCKYSQNIDHPRNLIFEKNVPIH